MKAKDLAQLLEVIVRKVVREELKPILSEVKKSQKPIIKETKSKSKRVNDPLDIDMKTILAIEENKKVSKPKKFTNDRVLNQLLNETHQSGEWRTMDGKPFTSNQAQNFMGGGTTEDIDGRPVDTSNPEVANVMGAITKDYSQLMKAIDKKKGR